MFTELIFFAFSVLILLLICSLIAWDLAREHYRKQTAILSQQAVMVSNQRRLISAIADIARNQRLGFDFDLWKLARTHSDMEGVTIRRAARMGYKQVARIEDGKEVWSLFQLCPSRSQTVGAKQ